MNVFTPKSGATAWIGVAVTAMAFMGVYAFTLVFARTPVIGPMLSAINFFKTALVTHVVLALVIWFLAFLVFIMHYITSEREASWMEYAAAGGGFLGVGLIVLTPLTGPANPVLNNYIPTLDRPLYFAGVSVFFLSALTASLLRAPIVWRADAPLIVRGSLIGGGFALFVALICIAFSWFSLRGAFEADELTTVYYFEALYWGGGHTLQFANTLGLMAVWAILGGGGNAKPLVSDTTAKLILGLILLFIITAPVQYSIYSYDDYNMREYFRLWKGWGLSFGPLVLGLSLVAGWKKIEGAISRRGLFFGLLLFGIGGAIALTLDHADTKVPAHYHAAIGGVTVSFMTLGLVAMVENGWLIVSEKWLVRQLTFYGAGQMMFVIGLFVGGRGGSARKSFGSEQSLDNALQLGGMGLMAAGGLLAITSGALFVIFMLKSFNSARKQASLSTS